MDVPKRINAFDPPSVADEPLALHMEQESHHARRFPLLAPGGRNALGLRGRGGVAQSAVRADHRRPSHEQDGDQPRTDHDDRQHERLAHSLGEPADDLRRERSGSEARPGIPRPR